MDLYEARAEKLNTSVNRTNDSSSSASNSFASIEVGEGRENRDLESEKKDDYPSVKERGGRSPLSN